MAKTKTARAPFGTFMSTYLYRLKWPGRETVETPRRPCIAGISRRRHDQAIVMENPDGGYADRMRPTDVARSVASRREQNSYVPIRNWSIAWTQHPELRYAKGASQQLLELFRRQQRERPELKGRALYEAVIARRLGSNPTFSAAEIVRRAKESFADWPIGRELKFRDVVHYQVFDEYIRRSQVVGTRTNFGVAVAQIIPAEL